MRWRGLVPFGIFLALLGFLGIGLTLNPREVPSVLIDKPVPAFSLARLDAPEQSFSPASMLGQPWLLNVWASWCVACRQEHGVLVSLSRDQIVPIVGLNYKEVRGDGALDARGIAFDAERALAIERARRWLDDHGDPYAFSVLDIDGRVGIDFGVYGVPETFLIDAAGQIRHKHIGPLTPEVVRNDLLPRIRALQTGS